MPTSGDVFSYMTTPITTTNVVRHTQKKSLLSLLPLLLF